MTCSFSVFRCADELICRFRNGDTATIEIAPDGKSLAVVDNHAPDADVPMYNPLRQYDEDVIEEEDEDEFGLPLSVEARKDL